MPFHYQIGGRERRVAWRSSTWLSRVLGAVLAGALVVLGFFFITIVLVLGVVAFLTMVIRWWWLSKTTPPSRTQPDDVIEVDSVVVHDDAPDPPHRIGP